MRTPPTAKCALIAAKLKTVIDRGYLVNGHVKSLIQYFDVPNADDIHIVYNGCTRGLNTIMWAPNFWLPTAQR
jgi:hypothetical protein